MWRREKWETDNITLHLTVLIESAVLAYVFDIQLIVVMYATQSAVTKIV